jgi:3-oxoacyl-[acyl-carrier protein] reductase
MPRSDGVEPDLAWCKFECQSPGQRFEGAFRGSVQQSSRHRMRGHNGAEVDDAPATGAEPLDRLLHGENRPENVDVVVEVKTLFGSSDREGAERVAQVIIDNGGAAITVGADVSKAADAARLFKEVDSAFGRLDVLVNNAGVFRFGAFGEITEESFHLHYNINVLGTILTVQQAIKRFGADGGSIINLSSIVGSHPVAGALLYASTKGALETLTRGLALELAPRKIRVNAIAPGHTETEGNVAAGTFAGGAGTVLAEKTPLGGSVA